MLVTFGGKESTETMRYFDHVSRIFGQSPRLYNEYVQSPHCSQNLAHRISTTSTITTQVHRSFSLI
jgi:hypothetical protein